MDSVRLTARAAEPSLTCGAWVRACCRTTFSAGTLRASLEVWVDPSDGALCKMDDAVGAARGAVDSDGGADGAAGRLDGSAGEGDGTVALSASAEARSGQAIVAPKATSDVTRKEYEHLARLGAVVSVMMKREFHSTGVG